ncbi:MAG TPA: hypothetical protein VGL93_10405 [Streptosporangiaceae bacterium]|jgi:hypothetical protein
MSTRPNLDGIAARAANIDTWMTEDVRRLAREDVPALIADNRAAWVAVELWSRRAVAGMSRVTRQWRRADAFREQRDAERARADRAEATLWVERRLFVVHDFEQNPHANVRVCRCGLWPDHHMHTGDQPTCGCDADRADRVKAAKYDALHRALRDLTAAADRLRDDWAEAGPGVRTELWRRLHEAADDAREVTDDLPAGGTEPTPSNVEAIARALHAAYDRATPRFDLATREYRPVPWDRLIDSDRAGLVTAIAHLIDTGMIHPGEQPPAAEPAGDSPEMRALYRERAHLVAHLAALHPSVLAYNDPNEPTRPVLYVDAHGGQLSWHISPDDLELFEHVPQVAPDDPRAKWDGHSTDTKYLRLGGLTDDAARVAAKKRKRARPTESSAYGVSGSVTLNVSPSREPDPRIIYVRDQRNGGMHT